ncbi:MAG: Gfo/Idh/MocA family protein [Solirubrobacteraceae bacterium]
MRHARDYAELVSRVSTLRLIGVAEEADAPSWAVADSRALAHAAGVPFMDMEQGFRACDAVLVCSEPTRHARLAAQALRAGRHVLIDKPPGVCATDLEELLRVRAQEPELVVTTVHRLYSPAVARGRHLVDAGQIGLPIAVDAEWIVSGGLDYATVQRPALVCDPSLSGGGELLNFGWYPVLALRHLTGLRVVEAFALGGALFANAPSGGPHGRFGVEDRALLSLALEHGVISTITITRAPSGPGHDPVASSMRVLGSHGYLVLDESAPGIWHHGTSGAATHITLGGSAGEEAVVACFEDFAAAIRSGGQAFLTVEEMIDALRVLDAARESLVSGQPVGVAE